MNVKTNKHILLHTKRFCFSHVNLRTYFKCLSNTAREDLLITSTDNNETSDKFVSPESSTACLPFLKPILFNIIFFHASISPHSLSLFPPTLTFYPFLSLSFSPYTLPHFTYASSPPHFFPPLLTVSFPIISSLFFSLD